MAYHSLKMEELTSQSDLRLGEIQARLWQLSLKMKQMHFKGQDKNSSIHLRLKDSISSLILKS